MEKSKREDMHRADIVAAVRKAGTSISALSVKMA
ncbi:Predicted transcriptional regulator [Actinobacillus equuli]|nr:Predicted transcriptional regulator [Actinobacillus equuli]